MLSDSLHRQEVYPNLQDDSQNWLQEEWGRLIPEFSVGDMTAADHISDEQISVTLKRAKSIFKMNMLTKP